MVRETLTDVLRIQLESFFEYLSTKPKKLGEFTRLSQDARLHALNQIQDFMNFEEWIKILKELKIPFPIKNNGSWSALPTHEDQVYKTMNANLTKGGKHARYSVRFAQKGKAPIYHMDNKTVSQIELENRCYNKDVEYFLTDGSNSKENKEIKDKE